MRRSFFIPSLLAACGLAGLAAADEPVPYHGGDGQPVQVRQRHPVVKWLHSRPIHSLINSEEPHGCYSHFNDYSCSSFDSECKFLFGGCRVFFGERCLKGPPPSPLPGFDIHTLSWVSSDGRRGPSGYGSWFDRQTGYVPGGYGGFPSGHPGCNCD